MHQYRGHQIYQPHQEEVPPEDAGRRGYGFKHVCNGASVHAIFSAGEGAGAVPASRRPNVQMPDEYLPPNKILFLQNLPENVTKDQLMALFSQYVAAFAGDPRFPDILALPRYPNLYEVRLIPTKKDIAFVEYLDEASATVAKEALHNYKLDGENKIKVYTLIVCLGWLCTDIPADYLCEKVVAFSSRPLLSLLAIMYTSSLVLPMDYVQQVYVPASAG